MKRIQLFFLFFSFVFLGCAKLEQPATLAPEGKDTQKKEDPAKPSSPKNFWNWLTGTPGGKVTAAAGAVTLTGATIATGVAVKNALDKKKAEDTEKARLKAIEDKKNAILNPINDEKIKSIIADDASQNKTSLLPHNADEAVKKQKFLEVLSAYEDHFEGKPESFVLLATQEPNDERWKKVQELIKLEGDLIVSLLEKALGDETDAKDNLKTSNPTIMKQKIRQQIQPSKEKARLIGASLTLNRGDFFDHNVYYDQFKGNFTNYNRINLTESGEDLDYTDALQPFLDSQENIPDGNLFVEHLLNLDNNKLKYRVLEYFPFSAYRMLPWIKHVWDLKKEALKTH